MTTTYENNGIHFMYPENWKLSESHSDGAHQISLESPQGCIWDMYRLEDTDHSSDWIEKLMESLCEQYDSFEKEPVEVSIGEWHLSGYEAFFYCLDLLIAAHVLELPAESEERRVLMYQGESREFDNQLPVFHAITMSLISHPV